MFLSQAIEGFLLDRDGEAIGDLSPRTIALYRHNLALLVQYLGDLEIDAILPGDLERFMDWLERGYVPRRSGTEKLSGYARDNYWKAIRSFFGWVAGEFNLSRIDLSLPRPAFAAEEIDPYSEDEIRIILEACQYTREAETKKRVGFRMRRPTAIRDRAIILLLLETGIRLGELARLKMGDVDIAGMEVHIHPYRTGKKSKPRRIPFGKSCRKALWHFRSQHQTETESDDLFFALELRSFQSLFLRIQQRTGIQKVHAHRFRHTFAIQYLRNGGDLFTLQRILGHSSLEICRKYLALAQSDVREAHRKASPADNWRL